MYLIPKILLTYFLIASIAGYTFRLGEKSGVIIYAPNMRFNYSFSHWKIQHYLSAAIFFGVLVFFVAGYTKVLFQGNIRPIIIASYVLTAIASITLIAIRSRIVTIYKKLTFLVNSCLVLSALYVTYKSAAIADHDIAIFTTVNASNFPAAQKIITLCAAVMRWIYYSMFAAMVIYGIVGLAMGLTIWLHEKKNKKRTQWRRCLIGTPSATLPDYREVIIYMSMFLGSAYTISFTLVLISSISTEKIDNALKELIVETSFHLPPEVCDFALPDKSKLSLIGDNQAVIAIPDKDYGYKFSVAKCERSLEKLPKLILELDVNLIKLANSGAKPETDRAIENYR